MTDRSSKARRVNAETLRRGALWAQIITLPIAFFSAVATTYYARDAVSIAERALASELKHKAISIRPAISATATIADTSLKISNSGNGSAILAFAGIKFRDKCATTDKIETWPKAFVDVTSAFLDSYISGLQAENLVPSETRLKSNGSSYSPSLGLAKGEEWILIRGEEKLPIADKDQSKAVEIWLKLIKDLHFMMDYQDETREGFHHFSTGPNSKAEIQKCLQPAR